MPEMGISNVTVELLSAADKLGAVGVLVLVVGYLIWRQKQDSKNFAEPLKDFVITETARMDKIEQLLHITHEKNETLKEVIKDLRDDIKGAKNDIHDVKTELIRQNAKFA